jgi:hypothetical protein
MRAVIREHVERHKVVYSVGAIVVVAGITYLIMKGRTIGVASSIPNGSEMITNRPFTFFSNRTNIITVLEREGRGHPGFRILCDETGQTWDSQIKAAADAGTHPIYMSKHVRGEMSDIHGKHYRRIAA